MKRQTGIWVDGQVWQGYRELCSGERLRPSEAVEEFLRFVLRGGSVLGAMRLIRAVAESRCESFDAYARVLLDWLRKDVYYVVTVDEAEASVEYMLLEALKQVTDPNLRKEVEEALKNARSKVEIEESPPPVIEQARPESAEVESKREVEPSVEELKRKIADLKRAKELLRKKK